MKGLPIRLRMKMLEANPTAALKDMISFAQRFRALEEIPAEFTAAVIPDKAPSPVSPEESQEERIDQLQAMVSKLAEDQANFIAAVSASSGPSSTQPRGVARTVRCFFCHAEGHIARNCERRKTARKCSLCQGWGHSPDVCGNNKEQGRKFFDNSRSLNYQGMPR